MPDHKEKDIDKLTNIVPKLKGKQNFPRWREFLELACRHYDKHLWQIVTGQNLCPEGPVDYADNEIRGTGDPSLLKAACGKFRSR
ncbi:hypothetical protein N7532_007242 [Penicillium argentinense]|uniref:Uncharacterized protein n=1 Tax=Penicillium argentinense TaxID=1131581 RepID=A0A9W9K747_9EURO|nr:uncharacterized protein N7532_007242 [Penicillium argentinense]KAJ5094951.1 hypothetical protein N7532_007242 [Penicillium argentinense]